MMQHEMINRCAGGAAAILCSVSTKSGAALKDIDAHRMRGLLFDRLSLPHGGIGGPLTACHPGLAQ